MSKERVRSFQKKGPELVKKKIQIRTEELSSSCKTNGPDSMKGWVQIKLNLRSKGRSKQWSRYGQKTDTVQNWSKEKSRSSQKKSPNMVKRKVWIYSKESTGSNQKKGPDPFKRKHWILSKERSGSIQKKALDLIKRKVQIHSKETLDLDKRMILIDILYSTCCNQMRLIQMFLACGCVLTLGMWLCLNSWHVAVS